MDSSSFRHNYSFIEITDGDCGRGFSRINDMCVNVSITTASKDDITAKCSEMGANIEPLVTKSASFLFQLRVYYFISLKDC